MTPRKNNSIRYTIRSAGAGRVLDSAHMVEFGDVAVCVERDAHAGAPRHIVDDDRLVRRLVDGAVMVENALL